MKLCSVCDKKINGSWCKNCHRFVKTYHLADGIYLNESHNPANDKDCTYHAHTVQNAQPAVRNTQQTSQSTQPAARSTQSASRNTQQTSRNTQSARNTQQPARNAQTYGGSSGNGHTAGSAGGQKGAQAKQKRTGLIVAVIIILYVVVVAASTVIPLIVDNVGEMFTDSRYEEEKPDAPDEPDLPDDDPLAEAKRQLEEIKQIQAIKKLEPVETEEEDDYICFYYNPEEIQKLGFACNMKEHFDWTLAEFEAWLRQNMNEEFEMSEVMAPYYNYYYESEDYWGTSFSSYRDYVVSDYFGVRVEYDTAMEKLHAVGFVSLTDRNYPALYFALLKKLDPETEWTQKTFSERLAEAELSEESMSFYSSDVLTIYSQVQDGVLSLVFYPEYQ